MSISESDMQAGGFFGSRFGVSRSNLFDPTSFRLSASHQHLGVCSKNDDDEDCASPSQMKSNSEVGGSTPRPVAVMNRELSLSHFGESRRNLFNENSAMPSAAQQMGLLSLAKEQGDDVPRSKPRFSEVDMERRGSVSSYLHCEEVDDEFATTLSSEEPFIQDFLLEIDSQLKLSTSKKELSSSTLPPMQQAPKSVMIRSPSQPTTRTQSPRTKKLSKSNI